MKISKKKEYVKLATKNGYVFIDYNTEKNLVDKIEFIINEKYHKDFDVNFVVEKKDNTLKKIIIKRKNNENISDN